jgi:hypothetical protein
MTPVTPHQPLPSHWYISEARGLSLSRSKLVSLEFGSKTRPGGADRALHPSGARPTRSVRDRVLFCSDGSLLQLPKMMIGFPLPL